MQLIQPVILIGDSQEMTRRATALVIQTEIGDYKIVQADSCASVLAALDKHAFTHLVLDTVFRDGPALSFLHVIKNKHVSLKLLFYSIQRPEISRESSQMLNMPAYLSKTAGPIELVKMLRAFFTTGIADSSHTGDTFSKPRPFFNLTPRELEVLYYLLNGLGTKQIAETLHLKMNSVSTYKKRIFIKTGTVNFRTLAELCMQHNIRY